MRYPTNSAARALSFTSVYGMRYFALATDYDGTLATDGEVAASTLAALARLRQSGRKLILVTGREYDDLARVCPRLDLFDRLVLENGAVTMRPDTHEQRVLAPPPPPAFTARLRAAGVTPLSVGEVVVATREPHQQAVLDTIRGLGLELQVIFNKGAVMVLPSGVNKATGLAYALADLQLSPHNVVAVGDAENDHALLSACECGVAVANALPMLQRHADWVTRGACGAGVEELIDALLADDLAQVAPTRHTLNLGDAEAPVTVAPYGESLMLAGTSGSGKSTFATAFLEQLQAHGYQYCIVDPEGDYENLAGAVVLGASDNSPTVAEVVAVLRTPTQNAAVNLLGIALEERPTFFASLLPALLKLRAQTGRPHWLVFDEAHHLLPADWVPAQATVPQTLHGLVLITVHPQHVARGLLELLDAVIAIGETPAQTLAAFAGALGLPAPGVADTALAPGEGIVWRRRDDAPPVRFRVNAPRTERQRHLRKYAEGDLGDHSFYFRGPKAALNLRAQNLWVFVQIGAGVDDATWLHHLRRHDYSRWFRDRVKDPELADAAHAIEADAGLSAADSRERIRKEIERRYTARD